MPKIDKQYQHDLKYGFETKDEYRDRYFKQSLQLYQDNWDTIANTHWGSKRKFGKRVPETHKFILTPQGNKLDVWRGLGSTALAFRRTENFASSTYEQGKAQVLRESTTEVPISTSLGIVGGIGPVQTNVVAETPIGGVDYSGQKRKKVSGVSYDLGLL